MNDICWSCQRPIDATDELSRARLASDFPLPVCRKCWGQIPISCRVKLAVQFRDRGPGQQNIADVLEVLRELLKRVEMDGRLPDWLQGGDYDVN